MAVSNANAVAYAELTDEILKEYHKGIELFVKHEEYWDKFAHHSFVPKGHKTFTQRVLIKPIVKPADISERAEFVAPRPTKMALKTIEKTVANYGDKAIYSREDLQYHFDDTRANLLYVLKEIAVQKLDLIKGHAFVNSRAVLTPIQVSSKDDVLETSKYAAIVLRKNDVNRWGEGLYLAHITPEGLKKLRDEIEAKGSRLSEPVKVELDGRTYDVFKYGDFMYSVTTSPVMYNADGTQNVVFMGRRAIDGQSPVDVAKLQGESNIELINKGLGRGVLVDVDGNYTADDNNQQGAIAINMDGLGAAVSDDLCILNAKFTFDSGEIRKDLLEQDKGLTFVSMSGNLVEITLSTANLTNAHLEIAGYAKYDSANSKYYAAGSTFIKVQAKADATYTLANLTASNWSAVFESTKNAKIVSCFKTVKDNDTVIIEVPNNVSGAITVATTATAS